MAERLNRCPSPNYRVTCRRPYDRAIRPARPPRGRRRCCSPPSRDQSISRLPARVISGCSCRAVLTNARRRHRRIATPTCVSSICNLSRSPTPPLCLRRLWAAVNLPTPQATDRSLPLRVCRASTGRPMAPCPARRFRRRTRCQLLRPILRRRPAQQLLRQRPLSLSNRALRALRRPAHRQRAS
jgi:hypothetical protein